MFTKGNNLNSSIFKLSNSNDILKGFNINKDKTKGTVDVSNLDSNDIESYLKGYLSKVLDTIYNGIDRCYSSVKYLNISYKIGDRKNLLYFY